MPTDMGSAVEVVIDAAGVGRGVPVRLSNAYCVALASRDSEYCSLLNGDGFNFPDGSPVVWAMRARRSDNRQVSRVRGPSLFRQTIDRGRNHDLRNFLLGTDESTLAALEKNLNTKFPGVDIAGSFAPPYGKVDAAFVDACVQSISGTDANIVWVALGTPKQDFVAAELSTRLSVPCVGVGAAFDFEAGVIREAPVWVQKVSLEWLYRLCAEPRRLWKRYIFGNVRFLYSFLVEAFRERSASK
nr:WecB/TagA/CpsF family glycosyltransferase [Rhodococcus sp. (in: high G+C Gram-positive bacteria)]